MRIVLIVAMLSACAPKSNAADAKPSNTSSLNQPSISVSVTPLPEVLLVGSVDTGNRTVDLTAEGSSDWRHWTGYSYDYKASGNSQISNYTVIGSGPVLPYDDDVRSMSWNDGLPTPKSSNNTSGIYIANIGNGFHLTAPADTNVRTIKVYVGGWQSGGTLTASMSDGSVPNYVDSTPKNKRDSYNANYTITFKTVSSGARLNIDWVQTSGTGNVTLNGAALTGPVNLLSASSNPTTPAITPTPLSGNNLVINRSNYASRMRAFWLSESIANWTGVNQCEGRRNWKPYFTDKDWAFMHYYIDEDPFGGDDDTDIEYIYQYALNFYDTSKLTGPQIRDAWLGHMDGSYIWVSDQSAYELMRKKGLYAPDTGDPANNPNWEMIDAQLTTESFGLMAPGNPAVALDIARLPVQNVARGDAEAAANFYIIMHSLAPYALVTITKDANGDGSVYDEQVFWLAAQARARTPDVTYVARMYDWVLNAYNHNPDKDNWEATRDDFHDTWIAQPRDGYKYDHLNNKFYDSGSNFGLSMISLMFGGGDLLKTVRVACLSGMDADNPTATWGGLLGFLYDYPGVEQAYNKYDFSDNYWIGRTRPSFDQPIDTFTSMGIRAVKNADRVVVDLMGGQIQADNWIIPNAGP